MVAAAAAPPCAIVSSSLRCLSTHDHRQHPQCPSMLLIPPRAAAPQFGPSDAMQQHGFARNLDWEISSTSADLQPDEKDPEVELVLVDNEYSRAMWCASGATSSVPSIVSERERERERETDAERERERERETDRERETERGRDRDGEIDRDRQRRRETERQTETEILRADDAFSVPCLTSREPPPVLLLMPHQGLPVQAGLLRLPARRGAPDRVQGPQHRYHGHHLHRGHPFLL